jgi:hypothetical protein
MAMANDSPLEGGYQAGLALLYQRAGREGADRDIARMPSCDEAALEDAEKVWLGSTTKKAGETRS